MTTPSSSTRPGQTEKPPSAEEQHAKDVERWSRVAVVLVVAAGVGVLFIDRFPETVALGVLALLGVAAAVVARRLHDRTGRPTAGGQGPQGAPPPQGPGRAPQGAPRPQGSGQPPRGTPPRQAAARRQGAPRPQGSGQPPRGTSARPGADGAKGGGGSRTELTAEQRRSRSIVATIVLGSVIAALHLVPALAWSTSMDRQACLDDAVTNQAQAECEQRFRTDLTSWLPR